MRPRSTAFFLAVLLLAPDLLRAKIPDVPAGTTVSIRLRHSVSSFSAHQGDGVYAIAIAPVVHDGRIVVPLGAEVTGRVTEVRRVGAGFSRERARLQFIFDTVHFPDGTTGSVAARVSALDNARETVDASGRIQGIRATASFSSVFSGLGISLGFVDPMLLAFTTTSSLSLFRIPESEIILPAGTELEVTLTEPGALTADFADVMPAVAPSVDEADQLTALVRALPFRTATEVGNIPSDITNLLFLGTASAVQRAFDAAGWARSDARDARSTYATMRSIVENEGYREAPMSTLLLDGAPPAFTYSKTLNTFFARHHLRVFARPETFDEATVWTSSSTHDSGIGFGTKAKTFIHVIDREIDLERAKVVNDLRLTGCVDAVQLIDRPWIPEHASNATGDALLSDRRIAVVRLNACASPARADAEANDDTVRLRAPGAERAFRDVMLTLRNDLIRGNVIHQAYSGVRLAIGALRGPKPRAPGAERSIHLGGEEFHVVAGPEAHQHPMAPEGLADPPEMREADVRVLPPSRLEIAFSGGGFALGGSAFGTQSFIPVPPVAGSGGAFAGDTTLDDGWSVSSRMTINTHRFVSHEIAYTFSHTRFATEFEGKPEDDLEAPAQVSQFAYNVLVHLKPGGSRVRPYAAVGPAMQLIRLREGVQNAHGTRLHFRDLGPIENAYRFATDPPLEGGGIFQAAFQYGAGVKLQVSPHVLLRGDYRESLSQQPDFWTSSYKRGAALEIEPGVPVRPTAYRTAGLFRQQLVSAGIGVTW